MENFIEDFCESFLIGITVLGVLFMTVAVVAAVVIGFKEYNKISSINIQQNLEIQMIKEQINELSDKKIPQIIKKSIYSCSHPQDLDEMRIRLDILEAEINNTMFSEDMALREAAAKGDIKHAAGE